MKFGIQLHPWHSFPDQLAIREFVVRAEAAGYDYVNIPVHTVLPLDQEPLMGRAWWDPMVMTAHLAAHTERIRFAFYVLPLPQYEPVNLAKQIATLDVLSGGRIDVGVGVGWLAGEFAMMGADFHTRGARADEYVRVLKALWTSDPVDFEGAFVKLHRASFHPKPVQQPHPPIFIGGSWRVSAARAARIGDGWLPMGTSDEEFAAAVELLHSELAKAGRPAKGFPLGNRIPMFEPSPEATAHAIEAGASVQKYLNGDYDAAIERVHRFAEHGVTHMWLEHSLDYRSKLAEMEEFAERVIRPLGGRPPLPDGGSVEAVVDS